jgi:acetylornithine deacetylase/succinyl-diaminopimelate desuccinylase-like protein
MPLAPHAADHVEHAWDTIVPVLEQYISIPNVSVAFDPEWAEHGHMQRAVELVRGWCASRAIEGATVEVHELAGRTPVIVIEVPAFGDAPADDTVVLYGHLDKQPEMHGWRDGLGPWTPVIEGDRLYGRGGADDGYAAFATLAAIEAVRAGGGAHTRCVVLIEASEESGSPDLPAYVEALADRIGTPSFVVCLDSGCIDYDRMWLTTSLRGIVNLALSVDIVRDGLHSGESGMIPSTFRIARALLSRIEDEATGRVLLDTCDVTIPDDRVAEADATAKEIGTIADRYPLVDGAQPMTPDGAEQLLGRTWRAALSVIGADGLPPTAVAGNVLRPNTTLELSLRTPPTADAEAVLAEMRERLLADPPYGARVEVTASAPASGWNAPPLAPWLVAALDDASVVAFGQPTRMYGVGGTIPFMGMLGERFPEAQFAITGVLGPDANAHGPNEYLHLPTARKITLAIAELLNSHARRG